MTAPGLPTGSQELALFARCDLQCPAATHVTRILTALAADAQRLAASAAATSSAEEAAWWSCVAELLQHAGRVVDGKEQP